MTKAKSSDLKKIIRDCIKDIQVNQKVLNFVKNFKGKKILLTFGDESFQKLKIKTLGLTKYFDQIQITNKAKLDQVGYLIKGYDDVTVIDNDQEFLDGVTTKFPRARTILVRDFPSNLRGF